jgi:carboxypeptidase C (cathepsin A)
MRSAAICLIFVLSLFSASFAQEEKEKEKKPEAPEFKPEFPKEILSSTKHTVTIGGTSVSYTATAGNILLKQEDGRPKANFFFISYIKDGVQDSARRPLTYSFNGGPGSSSVWLHLGVLGPKRVEVENEKGVIPPPYKLIDNEYSMLDLTDLVFIDPITTGYSRAVPGESDKQYHGVREDVESVGEFIRLYTTRFKRWSSPKFLIGESYGTTRAANLVNYLQERHGMYFNGVMLVSSILQMQTARFDVGNDLPYVLFLPTYTATAWYHKKLSADLQGDLKTTLLQVEQFALNEYTLALMKGKNLTSQEQNNIAEKLSRYTGLSKEYIQRSNLRVPIFHFVKELMRTERKTVGRLDSRFVGIDRDAAGESFESDPSLAAITGPYTATLNDYVRGELKYESELPYEILTDRVGPWNFGPENQNRYLNVAEFLRQAINQNPSLKVHVANGFYDLATPYFATRYTFDHLGLEPDLQNNVTMSYYEAGHMMYIHKPSLIQLKQNLANFVKSVLQ